MLRSLTFSCRITTYTGGYAALRLASTSCQTAPTIKTGEKDDNAKPQNTVKRSLNDFIESGRLTLMAKAPTDDLGRRAVADAHNADVTKLLAASQKVLLIYPDCSWRSSLGMRPRVGAAAVGFVASSGGMQEVFARSRQLKGTTSQQMAELVAAQMGVKGGIEYAKTHDVKHIRIHPDDIGVVRSVLNEGQERDGAWYYEDIQSRVHDFLVEDNSRTVSFEWVPGHEGIAGNMRADGLAKAATKVAGEGAAVGVGGVTK